MEPKKGLIGCKKTSRNLRTNLNVGRSFEAYKTFRYFVEPSCAQETVQKTVATKTTLCFC